MSKKRIGTGLVIALGIVAIWFGGVPDAVKHFPHPPANFRMITGVVLGEAGIAIALIVGMLTDGIGFHIPLSRSGETSRIDWFSIFGVLIWHISASLVFAVLYLIITGHNIPTASPINMDLGTLENMNKVILFLTALITAGLAAFIEEIFFRGYLISRLSKLGIHPLVAGVASGLLFALVHVPSYGWLVSLPKFIGLGLFAGLYVGWRGRLWPMIIAHFIIDFVGLMALGFLPVQ